jgi:hypothetical protein
LPAAIYFLTAVAVGTVELTKNAPEVMRTVENVAYRKQLMLINKFYDYCRGIIIAIYVNSKNKQV